VAPVGQELDFRTIPALLGGAPFGWPSNKQPRNHRLGIGASSYVSLEVHL